MLAGVGILRFTAIKMWGRGCSYENYCGLHRAQNVHTGTPSFSKGKSTSRALPWPGQGWCCSAQWFPNNHTDTTYLSSAAFVLLPFVLCRQKKRPITAVLSSLSTDPHDSTVFSDATSLTGGCHAGGTGGTGKVACGMGRSRIRAQIQWTCNREADSWESKTTAFSLKREVCSYKSHGIKVEATDQKKWIYLGLLMTTCKVA